MVALVKEALYSWEAIGEESTVVCTPGRYCPTKNSFYSIEGGRPGFGGCLEIVAVTPVSV
jgi:hypothetical protein